MVKARDCDASADGDAAGPSRAHPADLVVALLAATIDLVILGALWRVAPHGPSLLVASASLRVAAITAASAHVGAVVWLSLALARRGGDRAPAGDRWIWLAAGIVGVVAMALGGSVVLHAAGYAGSRLGAPHGQLAERALVGAVLTWGLATGGFATWGWSRAMGMVRPRWRPRTAGRWGVGAITLGAVATALVGQVLAWTRRPVALDDAAAHHRLRAILRPAPPTTHEPAPGIMRCASAPHAVDFTAFAVVSQTDGTRRTRCLQGSADSVTDELRTLLPAPSMIAVVVERRVVRGPLRWLSAPSLTLRPQIDALCRGSTCAMPWVLVDDGAAVLATLPELPGPPPTPAELGDEDAPIVRLRLHAWWPDTPPWTHARSVAAAERFVADAADDLGQFRYDYTPARDDGHHDRYSLARQAGITLALCRHGREASSRAVARRAAHFLAGHERKGEDGSPTGELSRVLDPQVHWLSEQALPLTALLACRPRTGTRYDAVIARMGRRLLARQRRGGDFEVAIRAGDLHAVPRSSSTPVDEPYVQGQAIVALLEWHAALDQLATEEVMPAPADLDRAIGRAMRHAAHEYARDGLHGVVTLEENWHCTAAARAIELGWATPERIDPAVWRDYQDLCLTYVEQRMGWIIGEDPSAPGSLDGGFGLGRLGITHHGATAGLSESLAAAAVVTRDRGEHLAAQRFLTHLGRTTAYLRRFQWREDRCLPCREPAHASGGWSATPRSATGRLDTVQHAWNAMVLAKQLGA